MIRMLESFDGNDLGKWDSTNAGTGGGLNASGRTDYCMQLGRGSSLTKTFDDQATWIVGMAYMKAAHFENSIIRLLDGGTLQCGLGMNTLGQFTVYGPTGGVIATDSAVQPNGAWVYVEFKATIHNSAGSYEVRVNGETRLSATGVDLQATGSAVADTVVIQGAQNEFSQPQAYADDIYIADGQTGTGYASDFVGDVKVKAIYPTGDGALEDFTPSSGVDGYAMVDETTHNSDTDYISSATVGHKETFLFGDLPAGAAAVRAVQVTSVIRKDEAGTRGVKHIVRHGGSNYQGTERFLGTSYQTYFDVWDANPGTGAEWTVADVNNNSEFGVEVTT